MTGPRSRWWKFYTTLIRDKAHYTDAQFRALITAISLGEEHQPYGELPKLPALRSLIGSDNVDFLVEEGDLDVGGDRPKIVGRDVYQAPVDRTATERQRRHRDAVTNTVDNDVDNGPNALVTRDMTVTGALASNSLSTSMSNDGATEDESLGAGAHNGDRDALDRWYELTQLRPWGKRSGVWLRELQDTHGLVHVVAALEVEAAASKSDPKDLLSRTAARLERQKARVDAAVAREPKRLTGVTAEIADAIRAREAAGSPETPPARSNGTNGHGPLASTVAAVVGSVQGDRASAREDVGTVDSQRPTRGPSSISGVANAVRPAASRSPEHTEAPTDGAKKEIV